jgi:hypothetical protein
MNCLRSSISKTSFTHLGCDIQPGCSLSIYSSVCSWRVTMIRVTDKWKITLACNIMVPVFKETRRLANVTRVWLLTLQDLPRNADGYSCEEIRSLWYLDVLYRVQNPSSRFCWSHSVYHLDDLSVFYMRLILISSSQCSLNDLLLWRYHTRIV